MPKDGLTTRPWYRWSPRDFLSDPVVACMSREQRWRYREALDFSWLSETPGRAVEGQWMVWLGFTPDEWEGVIRVYGPAFVAAGDEWVQKRLLEEWERSTARSRAASASAEHRHATSMRTLANAEPPLANGERTLADAIESREEERERSNEPLCPPRVDGAGHSVRTESPRDREWRESFPLFWEEYPKRQKRPDAEKAWKACPLRGQEGFDQVLEGLRRWKASRQWGKDGGEYIPLPATWIRAQQWNDSPEVDL